MITKDNDNIIYFKSTLVDDVAGEKGVILLVRKKIT